MAQPRRVLHGREAIREFLRRKWARELDYALRKELWCYQGNRISVRFEYESHDADGQWWRSYGNQHWEFDEATGLMRRRDASINDYSIERRAPDRDRLSARMPAGGDDAGVGLGVADGEAQVVGGQAGKGGARPHGDALRAQSRGGGAAVGEADEQEVRGAGVDDGAGGLDRRAMRSARCERGVPRDGPAWPGRMAMAWMAASASALTDQAGRWARSLAAKGTGASR